MILNTSCASCDYAEGNVVWPDYKEYQSFKLYDASGMEVPYQILDSVEECHIDSDINIVQRFCRMVGYHILLPVSGIPKCGFVAYRIQFSAEPALEQDKQQGIPKLENDYLRVSFHTNGTFSVEDKLSGKNYSQLHYFLDDGTNGDVYAYHQVPGDTPFDSRNLKWEVRQKDDGPLMQSVVLQTKMLLPMRMEESGKRSSEFVENDLKYCISLKKHSRQLEIHLSLNNQAQDHRLRLMVPTYTNSETAVADAPFYHESRAADRYPYYHPMHTFVQVHSADTGIAFLSRGISQFQLQKDKDRTLGITLHHGRSRLYAWLDWRDPRFDGIQCLGKNEYDYGNCRVVSAERTKDGAYVDIVNEGHTDTEDVVQIYVQNEGSTFAPLNPRLCAYKRIRCPAGRPQRVFLKINAEQMKVVNNAGEHVFDGRIVYWAGFGQPDRRTEVLTRNKTLQF